MDYQRYRLCTRLNHVLDGVVYDHPRSGRHFDCVCDRGAHANSCCIVYGFFDAYTICSNIIMGSESATDTTPSYVLLTVCTMLVIFGSIAILFTSGIVGKSDVSKSYTTDDLVRGWGIYATTLGLVAAFPNFTRSIFIACFASSIVWHLEIVRRSGWTPHHRQSVWINAAVLVMCVLYPMKLEK